MECTHCRKWHFKGVETCTVPGAPKENPFKEKVN
jgi:hypothetical protein